MVYLLPDEEELTLTPYDLISLQDAGVKGGAFAMRPLNEAHLESLALSDPATWPPLQVTLCTRGYLLIDGYHRWEVAKRLQLETFQATCRPYSSENEIVEAAFRANLTHGLKASSETRSDYAYWLHLTYPEMEQKEIAARAQISQPAVSIAIARREAAARKAMPGEEVPADVQKTLLKKSCRALARVALQFLDGIEELEDREVLETFTLVVKKREDRARLARIARLFGEEPR